MPKKKTYQIPVERAEKMRELQKRAYYVRRRTPVDHPNRVAAVELAEMMKEEYDKGASLTQIGSAVGITYKAVKFRMGRYGYSDLPPSMKANEIERLDEIKAAAGL